MIEPLLLVLADPRIWMSVGMLGGVIVALLAWGEL